MLEQATTLEEQIRIALARGYCYPENSHKEMDSALVNAMAEEVVKIITHNQQTQKSCERCEHLEHNRNIGAVSCRLPCIDNSHYQARK